VPAAVAYASAAPPTAGAAVEHLQALGARRVAVASYFLAPGRLYDIAVESALAAGAHGARMTGGGFGGCVLALIDADRAADTTRAVEAAYAARNFAPPTSWTVTAGPGATRL
jgi:galactokinase